MRVLLVGAGVLILLDSSFDFDLVDWVVGVVSYLSTQFKLDLGHLDWVVSIQLNQKPKPTLFYSEVNLIFMPFQGVGCPMSTWAKRLFTHFSLSCR